MGWLIVGLLPIAFANLADVLYPQSRCLEQLDDAGRNCTFYVENGWRCEELPNYDCHCACPPKTPTPAPTILVDWNPKLSAACLSCLMPRSIFYFHDNREDCLNRCEAMVGNKDNPRCDVVSWFDPTVTKDGFIMNCCPVEQCVAWEHTNSTTYFPDFKNCILKLGSPEVVPGASLEGILWRDCGQSGSMMIFQSPNGTTLWSKAIAVDGDDWFSAGTVPSVAQFDDVYKLMIQSNAKTVLASVEVKIIEPSCRKFGCTDDGMPMGCSCKPPCGPPGGFYDVCCDDLLQFCGPRNNTCTISIFPFTAPVNMEFNITTRWWGCPAGWLSVGKKLRYPSPGSGKLTIPSSIVNINLGATVLFKALTDDGKIYATTELQPGRENKTLNGIFKFTSGSNVSISLFLYGVDNNLASVGYWGGYHRTFFSRDTSLEVKGSSGYSEQAISGSSVQYMMEMDDEPLTLVFPSFTLRGKFETDCYDSEGDMFKTGQWHFNGDVYRTDKTKELLGTFHTMSS